LEKYLLLLEYKTVAKIYTSVKISKFEKRLIVPKRINSSREDATGNAVVARAQRWRPQVNGRKNNNKSKLLGRAEFTRRPGAWKRSVLEGYAIK
jgi:hypothetical protein